MPLQIDMPGKVIVIGLNYHSHAVETKMKPPTVPMVISHIQSALIGPGDAIVLPDPAIDDQIDFEAELGVVIGSRIKGIAAADALKAVRGYCCCNDVSARKEQMNGGHEIMPMSVLFGKCVDTFDPVGALTPAAEIRDPQNLRIRSIVNGRTMQDSNTSEMVFPVAELIAYICRTITLEPGDLIITGTPAGVGFLRDPPVYLRDGDEVTIDIEGLKPLTNPVRRGPR